MARLGIVSNENSNNNESDKYNNRFNYKWVLNELSKDYDIEGIDRIGFTDDGYEVFIVTDDYMLSDVPHFHYRKKEKGKIMEFHTCIRFDKAEYYHHTRKEDILSDTQKENLMKFFQRFSGNKRYQDNWSYMLSSWNHQNCYKMVVDENLTIPDYTKLVTRKKELIK